MIRLRCRAIMKEWPDTMPSRYYGTWVDSPAREQRECAGQNSCDPKDETGSERPL
jgi:hypothetical protein